jgi:hypothetical protein
VAIDTSSLSDEQKATAEFKEMYAGMMRQLSGAGFIPVLCAHEAAHVVYYQMMGPIQYKPLPPRILCDERTGRLNGQLAAVEIIDKPLCLWESWQSWIRMLARASVAGSVVARKLGATGSGGEEGDRLKFNDECAQVVNHFKIITIDTDVEWVRARRSVERDLEEYSYRLESIQKLALELQSQFDL